MKKNTFHNNGEYCVIMYSVAINFRLHDVSCTSVYEYE